MLFAYFKVTHVHQSLRKEPSKIIVPAKIPFRLTSICDSWSICKPTFVGSCGWRRWYCLSAARWRYCLSAARWWYCLSAARWWYCLSAARWWCSFTSTPLPEAWKIMIYHLYWFPSEFKGQVFYNDREITLHSFNNLDSKILTNISLNKVVRVNFFFIVPNCIRN